MFGIACLSIVVNFLIFVPDSQCVALSSPIPDNDTLTELASVTVSLRSSTSDPATESVAVAVPFSSATTRLANDGVITVTNRPDTLPDTHCDDLAVENGTVVITIKGALYYACDNGYSFVGDNLRVCSQNGSWSGEDPTCVLDSEPVSKGIFEANKQENVSDVAVTEKQDTLNTNCEAPVIVHGSASKIGDQASYNCDAGYHLIGESLRVCLANESWSGEDPTCVMDMFCPEFKAVYFATYRTTPANESRWYKQDTQVTYVCEHNQTISSTIICNKTGHWVGTAPYCTDPRFDVAVDLSSEWQDVFWNNIDWRGTYSSDGNIVEFKATVVKHHELRQKTLLLLKLVDAQNQQLFLKVEYHEKLFTMKQIEPIPSDNNDLFVPSQNFSLTGYMTSEQSGYRFYSSRVLNSGGISALNMAPVNQKGGSQKSSVKVSKSETQVTLVLLTVGCIIAIVIIVLASAVLSVLQRRRRFKQGQHYAVTSFENPVYGCKNLIHNSGSNEHLELQSEQINEIAASDDPLSYAVDKEQEESSDNKYDKSKSSVEKTKRVLNFKELDDLIDRYDEESELREKPKEVLGIIFEYEAIKLVIYVTDSQSVAVANFLYVNNFTSIQNMEVLETTIEDVGY